VQKIFSTPIILSLFLAFFCSYACSADNKPAQFEKQPEIRQVKPKKPVRIRLKRSQEGKYTWDITGDDVNEVVQADKRLRKLLNTE
jgi:translation initiation factor 1 (eIF-1/SUI1)